jgi:aspartokinase
MKTITNSVRTVMQNDEVAREASRRGILNSSAYAREILPQIEKETWKDVEETSVTVAINRIAKNQKWLAIKPHIQFDKIAIETGLVDVTFEKTVELQKMLSSTVSSVRQELSNDLYIESTGQHQVTTIMSSRMWNRLSKLIHQKPIGIYTNQIALSISFDQKYLQVPNFIYGVLSILALEDINLIEIVSTMTEIVLVINSDDMELALKGLKKYLK